MLHIKSITTRLLKKNSSALILLVVLQLQLNIFGCQSQTAPFNSLNNSCAEIEIPLNPVACFNQQSKTQIIEQRKKALAQFPQLILGTYSANPVVFDQIVDGKPWWSMEGSFVYGSGARSTKGNSEESRFILNPFLLVAANSWSTLIWDPDKMKGDEFADSNFPFCYMPERIVINPKERKLTVTYDITAYHARLLAYDYCRKEKSTISDFGLTAYNARDFGYRYIHFDPKGSINVINTDNEANVDKAIEIKQFIHCGGSCGLLSGCNNMSPAQNEIDRLRLKGLPATASFTLWRQKPADISDKEDFKVVFQFK
ncbi:MAG: hypothetical protein KIT34_11035 [Cyanobacteria bacterium TGS_CYA1]|nr:hypothetical protein [Cyanobacteria bacterium TGS_CYA1]